ncbi:MAG: BON domain-containing protein [Desulfotignum sp.]|nr:BON domain-containing protein [Desulfobacteraceae bacterium]
MKTFVIGVLFGIIVGWGGVWYFTVGKDNQKVQETEDRVAAQIDETRETVNQILQAKLDAWELRPEDIRQELEEQGEVVRHKARDVGEWVSDQARDTQATAAIKAKLADDPDLSVFSISVSTTDGMVTLSGTVPSPEMLGKAMALALETENVREVVSTLEVE